MQSDIIQLGRHRLMGGDATDPEHVAALMADASADLVFTSPPYLDQRQYGGGRSANWDTLMQGMFSSMQVTAEAQVLVNLGLVHRGC